MIAQATLDIPRTEELREIVGEALQTYVPAGTGMRASLLAAVPPPWIQVGTRRVLDLFLAPLARSPDWKRLYIVSPWISNITEGASMTLSQLLRRVTDDRAMVYVVTRPPEDSVHQDAIDQLGATNRANVAIVPNLHMKLFTAQTAFGSFAMLGSANFTQGSLSNAELGVLVNDYGDGKHVLASLNREASQAYRLPGRQLIYRATF